ncbi:MAG: hypothetical protein ABSH21_11080 [Verrucomicrobiia bacterium]
MSFRKRCICRSILDPTQGVNQHQLAAHVIRFVVAGSDCCGATGAETSQAILNRLGLLLASGYQGFGIIPTERSGVPVELLLILQRSHDGGFQGGRNNNRRDLSCG